MASNALQRFQQRLALVAYMRYRFGVQEIHNQQSMREYTNALNALREGYDAEGRSYVYGFLKGRVRGIDEAALLQYDENVRRHTQRLNQHREHPIVLKYFQVLAALQTEYYLDRATHEPDAFLHDLNAFVAKENERQAGRIEYPPFAAADLNKLAYWMATGSGKTLLMHLNYYQYRHYRPDTAENILLITPNEGLSQQHITEMTRSDIPCRPFNANTTGDLFGETAGTVKVIEITKLVEEKRGGGASVEVAAFEGRNLVFVDEGHKGTGSEAQAWRRRREALAADGFTFEYSATFGQAVAGSTVEVEEEYGKAILFDYSYPRFYEDGYGKDYRILNLEHDLDPALTDRYLLANLLTFYEQVRTYHENEPVFYKKFNIAAPLLVFIGHTVIAGKTRSELSTNDKKSLSDVQVLVVFLDRVLRNENGWVPQAIDAILRGDSGLQRPDGSDLFVDAFRTLRQSALDGTAVYANMLQRLFHVQTTTGLHLVNLKTAEGEIGLRAGAADRIFGLINIGDDTNFLKLIEKRAPQLTIAEEQFSDALFQTVNQTDSPINVLIGAKKFIEGWDSWRVSTMGLMNIGRGEGPQIIQLFGRGVRLLGKDRSLKRSKDQDSSFPAGLPLLETLNIFGVRARYMVQFRDYLSEEGIDTEEQETVVITTRLNEDFQGKGLLVIRPQIETPFATAQRLTLTLDEACRPQIDLSPRLEMLVSEGLLQERPSVYETQPSQTLPADALPLLNWERLYREVWQFRNARGYHNLILDRRVLRQILAEAYYHLTCSPTMLQLHSFTDLGRLEQLALMILRKYVERFYTRRQRQWEMAQLVYQPLDRDDDNLIRFYEAHVRRSATEFLQTLKQMAAAPESALYQHDDGLPPRVYFDRHLYLPLLAQDTADDPVVTYSPPGLNKGEVRFVRSLRDYFRQGHGDGLLTEWEVFLLRNQVRGRGVGFLVGEDKYFPDFILWLKGSDRQHIVFIDPHGLLTAGDLHQNPKVQFYQGIKTYEQQLNERNGRDDITLHSFIISSQMGFDQLKQQVGFTMREEFHQLHTYFHNDSIGLLLQAVLAK